MQIRWIDNKQAQLDFFGFVLKQKEKSYSFFTFSSAVNKLSQRSYLNAQCPIA